MVSERSKILIISGPTASGKSALAIKRALENGADKSIIINADALQIYSGLPILSAQPDYQDQKLVAHFLYSALKHNQNSSVALWLNLATNQINQALENDQLPIVVGGTGLYISKLIDGINEIPAIDENLKTQIRQISSREELIKILVALGESLELIENLDKQRLGRRLEVLKQTGRTLSWWQNQPNKIFYPRQYFEHINLEPSREILYSRCDQRLITMFRNGALQEVESFLEKNPSEDAPITKTIGFLEIKDYLQGKLTIDQAIEIASKKTRNYAKRQLTWFRNQSAFALLQRDESANY